MDGSVRFFPRWNRDDTRQVVGLLHMVNAVFESNPNAGRWVEVGSLYGESATLFLGFPQIKSLVCVERSKQHAEALKKKLARYGHCEIVAVSSASYATTVPYRSVDVVYVDGSHEYEDVAKDIGGYWPAIADGGFLCGHDYVPEHHFGVVRAVNEFLDSDKSLTMRLFEDGSWMIPKEGKHEGATED